jgi:hypothetical protein
LDYAGRGCTRTAFDTAWIKDRKGTTWKRKV